MTDHNNDSFSYPSTCCALIGKFTGEHKSLHLEMLSNGLFMDQSFKMKLP